MLSESIHSFADLGNQVLLAIGLQQSLRRADKTRPYGYGFEQYVWAMISGVRPRTVGAWRARALHEPAMAQRLPMGIPPQPAWANPASRA